MPLVSGNSITRPPQTDARTPMEQGRHHHWEHTAGPCPSARSESSLLTRLSSPPWPRQLCSFPLPLFLHLPQTLGSPSAPGLSADIHLCTHWTIIYWAPTECLTLRDVLLSYFLGVQKPPERHPLHVLSLTLECHCFLSHPFIPLPLPPEDLSLPPRSASGRLLWAPHCSD